MAPRSTYICIYSIYIGYQSTRYFLLWTLFLVFSIISFSHQSFPLIQCVFLEKTRVIFSRMSLCSVWPLSDTQVLFLSAAPTAAGEGHLRLNTGSILSSPNCHTALFKRVKHETNNVFLPPLRYTLSTPARLLWWPEQSQNPQLPAVHLTVSPIFTMIVTFAAVGLW